MIRYLKMRKKLRDKIHNLQVTLKDALAKATSEPEVDYWKIALDDDIDKYILKEGEDER